MTEFGYDDLKIELDGPGGTLVDISNYVQSGIEVLVEALTEDTTPAGSSTRQFKAVGIKVADDIQLDGIFDDVASVGPKAVMEGGEGATKSLKVTWGGSNTDSVETILAKFGKKAAKDALTHYSATLRPTGAVTRT